MKNHNMLNLGSGTDIRQNMINVDFIKREGTDVTHDLNKYPYPFENNTFKYIYINLVLEELDSFEKTIFELYRISKPNAIWNITVPYYHSRTAFNPYHNMFFHCDTFNVFAKDKRTHITLEKPIFYEIISITLNPCNFIAKLIPKRFKNYIGMIFGEMYNRITFKMKVIK